LIEYDYDKKYLDKSIWNDIIFLDYVGESVLGRDKYSKCEKNYDLIASLIISFDSVNLFLSDIAWPMNNRLFFDSVLQKKVQYNLISDGLGLYALPKITFTLFYRGWLKSIVGRLNMGVKYRNYSGAVFGLDRNEIRKVYTPCTKLLNCPSHKKVDVYLGSFSRETVFDKQKCVFLDQPLWNVIDAENWEIIRSKAINVIKSLGINNIVYKNHYRSRIEEEKFFEEQGFRSIKDKRCIEEIVIEEGYGTVISYRCSALFNLKVTYGDRIRCISLWNNIVASKYSGYNENVTEKDSNIFDLVGVEKIRF